MQNKVHIKDGICKPEWLFLNKKLPGTINFYITENLIETERIFVGVIHI